MIRSSSCSVACCFGPEFVVFFWYWNLFRFQQVCHVRRCGSKWPLDVVARCDGRRAGLVPAVVSSKKKKKKKKPVDWTVCRFGGVRQGEAIRIVSYVRRGVSFLFLSRAQEPIIIINKTTNKNFFLSQNRPKTSNPIS